MHITDLQEIQWQYIKKVLHLQERKRKYSLYSIWNALGQIRPPEACCCPVAPFCDKGKPSTTAGGGVVFIP